MTLRLNHIFGQSLRAFLAVMVASACATSATAQSGPQHFGPQGAESGASRRQEWRVPSAAESPSRAVVLRPPGEGPFRLALIAHASVQNPIRRAQMKQPEYRMLAAWLLSRGFAVVISERPGHGATGGPYLEDQGGCADADYVRAGEGTAKSIEAALTYMRTQTFIRKDGGVIIGHSAGGFGALAMRDADGISNIVVFAPGRGGRADDKPDSVCAPDRLIAAARQFGRNARVPVTWIVSQNDSYFSPALSKRMADAFGSGGARVDFRVLPAFGSEGHGVAERDGGEKLWGDALAGALGLQR